MFCQGASAASSASASRSGGAAKYQTCAYSCPSCSRIAARRLRLFKLSSTSIAICSPPVSRSPSGRCGRSSEREVECWASERSQIQSPSRSSRSSRSRTSVTASMWPTMLAFGRQVLYGDRATRTPSGVSQRKEGPPRVSGLLSIQPAWRQRSRSQRPVRCVRPISRASCATLTAYCSPTSSSSRPSRSDKHTLPESLLFFLLFSRPRTTSSTSRATLILSPSSLSLSLVT